MHSVQNIVMNSNVFWEKKINYDFIHEIERKFEEKHVFLGNVNVNMEKQKKTARFIPRRRGNLWTEAFLLKIVARNENSPGRNLGKSGSSLKMNLKILPHKMKLRGD